MTPEQKTSYDKYLDYLERGERPAHLTTTKGKYTRYGPFVRERLAKLIPEDCKEEFDWIRWPNRMKILGESLKTDKGEKKGVLTAVVYLAAATRARPYGSQRSYCSNPSKGCLQACLGHTSGRCRMNDSQNAQVWKTLLLEYAPDHFWALFKQDLDAHVRAAERKGMTPAIRFNGSSDILPERLVHIMRQYAHVMFYDYTKDLDRIEAYVNSELPKNYHLTYSRSEDTRAHTARLALAIGVNVAVVFGDGLPEMWEGYPVVDGDESDARFLDPKGVVVGLSLKGGTKNDNGNGFVVWESKL